jgi:CDP-paratose 2-epimerase
VLHFAAQVAVTTSLANPVEDFEANLLGTLNVLEAIRKQDQPPPMLFTSTNKVYGNLQDIELIQAQDRYVPRDADTRTHGIGESRPLDFHSPYGCSKGAADQYVLDYARMYGLPATVFRMSCIYGRRQLGTEDQGWVAHFALQILRHQRLTVYGDGRQVRDILYIDDLIDAMLMAMEDIDLVAGRAFNIGGGPDNAVSLLEVIRHLAELSQAEPEVRYGSWRRGDQPYYVSDTRRFTEATGWTPQIPVEQGISQLRHWLLDGAQSGVSKVRE